jgi:putative spermidine/putrescine transport system ATP-binding protein
VSHLRLVGLSKRYGAAAAVDRVSLDIAPGEMVVLLGPSGCGKTTTLRMIAGFVAPSEGDIVVDGASVVASPVHARQMGMVFQSYALFPHMSVAANVGFGLEMRGVAKSARAARVEQMLRLVRLEQFAARRPAQLSGGQQQRVALARALAIEPRLLLLDEPLSNLDASLRQDMAREIRLLQKRQNLTAIMVTHDQTEAMSMADRLVVMREGRVEQVGTQEDLYEHPASTFVATFIGRSNLLTGTLVAPQSVRLADGAELRLVSPYPAGAACTVALRPERITLRPVGAPARDGARGYATGTVALASHLGAVAEYVVALTPQTSVVAHAPVVGEHAIRFAAGDEVALGWSAAGERLFGPDDAPLTAPEDVSQLVKG